MRKLPDMENVKKKEKPVYEILTSTHPSIKAPSIEELQNLKEGVSKGELNVFATGKGKTHWKL